MIQREYSHCGFPVSPRLPVQTFPFDWSTLIYLLMACERKSVYHFICPVFWIRYSCKKNSWLVYMTSSVHACFRTHFYSGDGCELTYIVINCFSTAFDNQKILDYCVNTLNDIYTDFKMFIFCPQLFMYVSKVVLFIPFHTWRILYELRTEETDFYDVHENHTKPHLAGGWKIFSLDWFLWFQRGSLWKGEKPNQQSDLEHHGPPPTATWCKTFVTWQYVFYDYVII